MAETQALEIIDDSYGQRPAYRLAATCTNCSWTGAVLREIGLIPRSRYKCPRCGCRHVITSSEWLGETERNAE